MIKRLAYLISLIILAIPGYSQSNTALEIKAKQLLAKNNPDAYYMIKEVHNIPPKIKIGDATIFQSIPKNYTRFIKNDTEWDLLSSISTYVHEYCHAYESAKVYAYYIDGTVPYKMDEQYSVYFINQEEEYLVKHTPIYKTSDIAKTIPKSLRTMRYRVYINARTNLLGSQQYGIYGLLDEWTAYYNGFKTNISNYNEYKKKAKGNPEDMLNFISDCANTALAYYEFKYYILEYLHYAQENHKEVYQGIINNLEFQNAYEAIDSAYTSMLNQYDNYQQDIKSQATQQGITVTEDNKYFYIGSRGAGTFSQDIQLLKEAIKSDRYKNLPFY